MIICIEAHTIYVADSESSTIRCVSAQNGSVKGLIGGGLDPMVSVVSMYRKYYLIGVHQLTFLYRTWHPSWVHQHPLM